MTAEKRIDDFIPGGQEYGVYHPVNTTFTQPGFHAHPHYEFYIYVSGRVRLAVEDERFEPEPWDLFLFPPGVMHRAEPIEESGRYERAYFYLARHTLAALSGDGFDMPSILDRAAVERRFSFRVGAEAGRRLVALCDELIAHGQDGTPGERLLDRCRLTALAVHTCRLMAAGEAVVHRPADRIGEIIRYLNDHITEPLPLDAVAERFFMSKYTLLHGFRDYANISVHRYIVLKRVAYAQVLIQRGAPPGEVARACGFNDYAGFYRAFVRQTGQSPQEYSAYWRGHGA